MNDKGAYMSSIVFATNVTPDKAIIHETESFRVQWKSFNSGPVENPAFSDRLIVTQLPEGCPGSDDQEHTVVFDSGTDGDADDFQEAALAPGAEGNLMQPMIGPFAAGSYRLTVTLDTSSTMTTSFNCVEIVRAI
jgi:hypothetical protein